MIKRKKVLLFLLLTLITILFLFYERSDKKRFAENWTSGQHLVSVDSSFEFLKGDILIRPNKRWLPGSIPIPGGRRYGHVAVVVEGAVGRNAEEALKKTRVVEALFYDQKTKRFLLNSSDQIREESAWVSFGDKFKGIRYRLRVPLTMEQSEKMCNFLRFQLDSRYNILSLKHSRAKNDVSEITSANRKTWQCATLTWKTFQIVTGFDIDGNGGLLIFPSDIIGSSVFDQDSSRICF
jgi:hypothetical protein